jgi:hypothetical protein
MAFLYCHFIKKQLKNQPENINLIKKWALCLYFINE